MLVYMELASNRSFLETLSLYLDKRVWVIFLLGMSSGFPWVIIGSAMSAWLKEADLTRTAIGFFGSITAVYAINFLWAPLLDRVKIPLFSQLGRRRSWILLMQLILLLGVIAISFTNPASSLLWTSLIALSIALASSTQDIAIDAYRIESISPEDNHMIPVGSAMATSGWWTGYSLAGALAFILVDLDGWSWSDVYRVMAGLIIAFGLSILVGVLISNSIIIKRILMPVVRLFAPIAPIAWVPIALVIFGIGNFTAIFIVIMGVFFTLTIATIQAIDEVPDEIISSAKTLGASKYQIISRVVVPYIMPSIFLSLRLNFIAAWMAVLAAEMTGLRDGLGAIIMVGRNLFNYDLILMGMFLIGVVGFLTDVSLRNIQEKYFWWSKK